MVRICNAQSGHQYMSIRVYMACTPSVRPVVRIDRHAAAMLVYVLPAGAWSILSMRH